MEIGTIYIEDMKIGLTRSISKIMGDSEIKSFAEISEDRNPLHLSDEAGQNSIFGRRVAHGAIYLSQSLQFIAPVYPGDKVDASVTVEKIDNSKKHVTLKCKALVSGKLVIKGHAIALAPSRS